MRLEDESTGAAQIEHQSIPTIVVIQVQFDLYFYWAG